MLVGTYNPWLVATSLLVAVMASYTALAMAGRTVTAPGKGATWWWRLGGGFAMGLGIWSMHFIGMLAFDLPIPLGYDLPITLLSLALAIGSSVFALWLVSLRTLPHPRLAGGALLMGSGIASMHYVGMAAMRMQPGIDYQPVWLLLSLLVAVAASWTALYVAFRLRAQHTRIGDRLAAAGLLGLAIVGMHYTGMAAAKFPEGSVCGGALDGLTGDGLDYLVLVTTLAVLGMTLLTSVLDARLESRTAALANSLTLANQELTQLALHDNLTGLPNRILLADRIGQAISQIDAVGGCLAVMFIDLDGFKPVNDAFGHHMGDQLLRAVASRLRTSLHGQDTLARIGGDEFVLLVSLEAAAYAKGIAARQVHLIGQTFEVAGHSLHISASIGIALYPGNGIDQNELLMNADAAMYHAKSSGKNGYSFFESSMNTNARKRLQLLQELRLAVAERQLRLFYQPKFDARSGKPVGAEALLRWEHPRMGLLAPAAFIDLAETTGLIIDIGHWVLDEACRQMREWVEMGFHDWRVAVNLSALQFGHAALVRTVAVTLARHGLAAANLTLEITESTAMSDADASMTVLQQLSDMGVDLSIDDFGTGYSSLMYLKRLPANELKIDRGFVRDLEQDGDDAAIVSAIVALGQALGLRIVAEGVETSNQQLFLTRLGCDSLQGYLLGHPLPAERFMHDIQAAMHTGSATQA